ncbi:MAG: hypothetical protein EWV76_09640 [Microcystis novacekii Mn_MB_F_20050700_S1]|nr:MAG: hypothetical protein EWV76_09640 [Microcystis novacekii Mn_MB_F_20050700_S1]
MQNQGTRVTNTSSWYDRIVFSSDTVFGNSDDIYLTEILASTFANLPLDPDETYNVTQNITLPDTVAGNGYLLVKTDNYNGQLESNKTDNIRSVAIAVNAPNLVISNPTSPPSAAVLGQTVPLSWRVTNTGTVSALAGWYDRVYLSNDGLLDSNDVNIGEFYRPNSLAPNASYTNNQNIFLPATSIGDRYLLFVTDVYRGQGETNETDNIIATPITLTAPDLTVTAATAPTTAVTSGTLNVSWTVTNGGDVVASADWSDEVRLSTNTIWGDSDDRSITSGTVSIAAQTPLNPNSSYTIERTVTLPSVVAGNYNLLFRADRSNQQGETNEENNVRSLPIAIAVPDLVVAAATAPTNGIASQSIAVSWTVTNQGTVDAAADWYDSVYLSTNNTFESFNDTRIASDLISTQTPLLAGNSYTFTRNVTLPNRPAGDYFLLFLADDAYWWGNSQRETDENNNVRAVPITIGVPDLTVSAATAPSSGVLGGAIDVSWTVTNTSTVTAPADWSDRIYFSTDEVWNPSSDTLITSEAIATQTPLNAGLSYTVNRTITLPNVASNGSGYLLFVADANANQAESNENNNVRSVPFTLNAPNLTVTGATAPSSVSLGSTIAVTWTVANSGQFPANANWYDSVYLSDNETFETSDVWLGERWSGNSQPIAVGGTYTGTRNITLPTTTTGNRYLLFITDQYANYSTTLNNRQGETNENDNIFALPINISSADLVLESAIAPSGGIIGNPITLSWTVKNQGTGEAPQDWRDYVYLSLNQTLDGSDTLLVNEAIATQTPLAADGSYTINKTVNLASITPGTRYLIFVADGSGNQGEINETNNQRVVEIVVTAPDLIVSTANAPTTAITGSNIAVSWTTSNQGTSEASADWSDAVYLSGDSLLDASDIFITSEAIASQTPLAAGASYTISRNIALPSNVSGDRFLLFVADNSNAQGEVDNTNNVRAVPIGINASAILSFSAATFRVNEDGTAIAPVTIERSGIITESVSVTLNLSNGTAIAGSDYNSSPRSVTFAPGETSKTVTIPIVNDSQLEADETVNLTLSNPTVGAILGTQTTAVLTIINDDLPQPGTISFNSNSYTVNENNGTASITLTRTVGSDGEVSVILTPSNGSAIAGDDYTNSPVTVTFVNGQTSKTVTIPITDDSIYEPTETVNLTISNPTGGATLGTQQTATLSIIDNDAIPGVIQFSNTTYSVNENGTPVTAVTLTRTNGSDGAVSVRINLTNGTATAPSDYNNTAITVNFANGETSKTVTIPIVNDTQFEPNETVNLTLSNPTGGVTLGTQTTAVLTIINDDLPQRGIINLNSSNYTANENGTANITLTRTNGSDGEVSVTLTPSDGTANQGSDYNNSPITVTFTNGQTSKTVTIPVTDDSIYEPTETVNLTLSNPTGGATLGTQQTAILTIIDNDAVPGVIQFSNGTYSINENGTPVTAVTLTRSNGSDGAVSVRINLTNGTATAPSDYNNTPITVNFANGETTKNVTIPIIDDSVLETTETINLTLSNPSNGVTIGSQNSAIVNIIDNDFKPTLTVNIVAEQITEGNTIQGTVTRNTDTTDPLTVTLVSSDNTQLTVPTTVIIPAGSNSVNFNLNAVDDTLIELPKNYTIIATSQGFVSGSDTLAVIDNDSVTLTLTILPPSQGGSGGISENGGKAIATVTRNVITSTPLVVQLSSSDTTEATVPTSVIIAAGQASATFEISAVDDTALDGNQTVTITAKPTYTGTNLATDTGNATTNISIIDNESPTLKVVIDKDVISETGTATATITRNTNTSSDLIVTLNSSDTTEATVPNTVTIPVGQTSATFTIMGVSDGINDGSQTVTITASATGLNSGSDSLEVTDINVPDLVVTQLQGIQPTYTTKQSQFTYAVTNNGIIAATGSWKDRIYLSTDNKLDANDTLLGEFGLGSTENPANLLPGTSYNRTVTYFAPRNPGQYYLIGVTDNGNTVNEGVTIGESNNTTITPVTVTPAYRGTVYTDTETALAGSSVTLRGQALSNSDNSPVAYEFVKVRVENKGNIREFDAFTDGNGNFVRQFTPLTGEAGTYNINAYFPGFASEDSTPEDSFTLLGMRFEQNDQFLTQVSQRITEGTTFNGSVKLQNLSNIGLSGLTANVNGVPSDWTVNVTPEKTSLGGNEEITVNYSINVPDDKWSYYNFSVGLTTTEGVTATLPVRVDVARLLPRLVADTRSLQASMLRGGQTLVEFTVSNQGEVASGQLNIFLPEASWLKSASPVTLPSLNPGQSTKVSLLLQPSATQELTVYNGNVVISGDEASLSLPFNFRAISEAKGNLNISVVDELFFFAEGSPRLENATITLLDPFTGTVISSEKDADGILSKTDLAEGYYKLRVTADNHDAYEQNIYIGAGETENIQAFLSRQTVKYTWTVTPTEIEDKYIITVQSTFETNVPIPTVVIEPLSLDFADLQAVGQVMQIDMKVTNYGLIAANDIALNIGEHPFYKIEPLINGVDILAAKSSITIPVRITRIADFDTLASSGEISTSSGIQVPCSFSLGLSYDYECAGQKIKRAFPIPVLNVEGNCNLSLNPLPFPYPSFGGSNGPGGPRGGPVSGIVIPDFKVTSSDCNPCNEKLKQAVIKCVLDLVGIKEIIKCVPILRNISSGINSTEDLIDTSRTVPTPPPSSFFGCLKGFVKKKIKTPQYIYKCFKNLITACDDLSSSSTLSLASQLGISENYDKPFNLEDLEEQATRFEKINDVFALPFGDEIWLEGEESETLGDWLEAFLAKAEGTNGESLQISETQRQELLALPLPEPITGTDVNKFLDRWNRSIDYWNAGIFDLADVPQGESADFIALDLWEKAVNEASEANNSSLAKGFADLGEEIEASFTELQKALEGDSSGVCAKVKIQIDQEAVMTRAAFLGNLEIENGNPTNLTNLSVILQIKDQNGNIVNDKFGITDPILSNITAVDGTGILTGNDPNTPQNEGIGSAKWTFIPTNLAAPEIPTQYNIGGTLSYLENGKTITVPLLSTPITVFPQAELYLDYFHQRDVFADDPFTDDIVETSVPYSLAVLVRNEGKGDAKNLKITSGQPKIVENEKGLLIDFQIIGSEVNGQGVTPSLTVNFGDIKAGKTAVADWLLKSSLQGKFIDYKATFEHINSLGKAELSLIKEVKIHELIHTVQVNHSNPDNLPDFLVNETFDAQFTPDIIYFSSGGTAPVKAVKNATIDAPPTLNDLTVQISATVENGWTYFRLDEPSDSQFEIVKILRSDGTQISADNIWTTDRTFPATGRPNYENILHFFDNTTAGNTTYTVFYTPGGPSITDIIDVSPDPRATAVNAITVDFSEAIKASSFDYNDLSLTLNNGSNLINSTVTIVSLSPTRYQITGLNTLTNNDGEYNLTVNATGIQDSSGKFGTGSLSESWAKIATGNADTTPPNVTDIVNLLINPRNQPVPSLNVTFSEKIDLSTFTWQDITLTRNNGTNLINNTVTITAINDTTYRINGLSGLTAIDGTYNLTVNGSGIQDLSGNNGTGIQSETWIMDTIAPTIPTNITVTNPLTPSGINIESANIATLQPLTASGQQRINTTNPTISGDLGETGLKVFFYDKTTNTLLQQATVTGTQFSGSLQLPSPGARDIEIRLQDTAGNTSNTTLSLFADISQPVLTQFLNVPTSSANAINSIDVQFSEQINLNTFDKSDITLTRDGVILTLPNTVTVTSLSDTTYRINGLGELTNTPGIYNLKVDATTIQDNAGNSGDAAKNTNFTITSPPTPGITLTQTGGNTTVTEGGNTDTYSLVLKTQPTSDVTITLAGNSQITLNQTTLTFTPTNWNTPQTVTINAVDDTLTEGNHTATITHNISSTDTNYNGLTLPNVIVNIQDNDAEIKGNIWNDIDGNATDNNEPNLSGWTVYLDSNNNNQLDTGETSTQTNANGDYTFNNLRPGNYTVAQVVQNGWKQTYPILNITTTAADIPLTIPTLDLIPTSTNTQTQLNFNTANYIVKEDGTAITEIIINRSGNLAGTVTATLTFTDGTAKGCGCAASSINNDFNYSPITITFAENEISKVIPVQNAILNNPNAIRIRNDNKVEGDEYFTIQLTNPTNGAIIGNQGNATVTIIDDESPNNNPITPPISNPSNTLSTSQNTNATNLINLDDFWSDSRFSNIKGQGQSIVIIDTGADLNHTLFGADANNNGIADKIIYQYDFADNDTDASDKNNHGSHIASIASQIAPDANLIILKVFKDNGSGYFADLEEALQWVNTNANTYNVTSVNLSLGDNQNWTNATGRYGIGDELAAIAGQNILIAAAAGNSFYTFNSSPGLAYPAADPNVISVGAVWADDFGSGSFSNGAKDYTTAADRIASFSQRHPILDVFAPGILISGANATGGTITMGGTSQAVPYISAIATLSQQIAQTYLGRELTLTEFRTLLDTTSNLIIDGDDENDNVTNTGISYPRINALALAESILNLNDSNSGSGVVNPGNNNNNGSNTVTNTVSLVHNVTLTAGQILTGINFGNQQLPSNQPPTLNNINKSGDEDNSIDFSQSDFTSAFNDADGNTLVKIQITFLPNNGVLQLNNTAIALSQEITVSDLNNLTFTPNTNFNGNVSFSWNGFDGTVYADNAATVNITVNPVDDAPTVLNPITDVNVDEDAANTVIDISNVFTDIDK